MSEYTVLFPFCGLGAGAMGFLVDTSATIFGQTARFRSLGGIDNDDLACQDFVTLTKSPALCADISEVTPEQLRAFAGEECPDVVFLSAPCVASSKLVSDAKAATPKYRKMNLLGEVWIDLMLRTWKQCPKLVLFENVPNVVSKKRGLEMVNRVKAKLAAAGYVMHDGFHECGSLGGLAQKRKRWLMVARHAPTVAPLLYQPAPKRIRGCGEVIGPLPMPDDPAGGPMHTLPKISWLNWVRLALIPAGGDWRDLPGVLAKGEKRRKKFKRHAVSDWQKPTGTIGGPGSNGVENIADARVSGERFKIVNRVTSWGEPTGTICGRAEPASGGPAIADVRIPKAFKDGYGVLDWKKPTGTVTGSANPTRGRYDVPDPRVPRAFPGGYQVQLWEEPANTVIGEASVSNGASIADVRGPRFANVDRITPWNEPVGTITRSPAPSSGASAVADVRVPTNPEAFFHGFLRVVRWDEPAPTVTGSSAVARGPSSVADPRISLIPDVEPFDAAYGVLHFDQPSRTVAAGSDVGQGAYAIADVRLTCAPRAGAYGMLSWTEAAKTITGAACIDNGPFAIADARLPNAPPFCVVKDVTKAPIGGVPVIISEDGTWHRPVTTLELARLQDLPLLVDGAPLQLAWSLDKRGKKTSSHTAWRKRIGNAVPVGAARAIAVRMLTLLMAADAGAFALCGDGAVWVAPKRVRAKMKSRRQGGWTKIAPAAVAKMERMAVLGCAQ